MALGLVLTHALSASSMSDGVRIRERTSKTTQASWHHFFAFCVNMIDHIHETYDVPSHKLSYAAFKSRVASS